MNIKPRSWVELSTQAFEYNLKNYKSIIGNNTKIAVVIKSNGYGHDTICAAQLCQNQPLVDWICINSLSEALQAREHNITKPMLVISCIDDDPKKAIDNNIDVVGYNLDQIKKLNDRATSHNKPLYIHIKLDTGMTRLGFFPDELLACIDKILKMPFIKVRGIFTHFAESSKADLEFTNQQTTTFKYVIDKLKKKNIEIPIQHLANSAGIPLVTTNFTNMVRLGAGAFGLYPSQANKVIALKKYTHFSLVPVASWKTRIFHIKKVPAGRFVGYSRTYKTNRDTLIGFLPLGYHEGLDFKLSNQGVVWLEKQKKYAPIIGLICMNITMIDVTEIIDIAEEDEVTLIGQENLINPETIAELIGSNNIREITTNIVSNIPRTIVP